MLGGVELIGYWGGEDRLLEKERGGGGGGGGDGEREGEGGISSGGRRWGEGGGKREGVLERRRRWGLTAAREEVT